MSTSTSAGVCFFSVRPPRRPSRTENIGVFIKEKGN